MPNLTQRRNLSNRAYAQQLLGSKSIMQGWSNEPLVLRILNAGISYLSHFGPCISYNHLHQCKIEDRIGLQGAWLYASLFRFPFMFKWSGCQEVCDRLKGKSYVKFKGNGEKVSKELTFDSWGKRTALGKNITSQNKDRKSDASHINSHQTPTIRNK